MSYTPTEWKNGDVITAAGLNKMENGIAAGSLPTATASDAGKVPTVQGRLVPGAVIVPEQTVTMTGENDPVVTGVNEALVTAGAQCLFVINGTTYPCTVIQDDDAPPYIPATDDVGESVATIYATNEGGTDSWYFWTSESGDYAISLNVAEASAEYVLAETDRYDFIAKVDNSTSGATVAYVSGDFSRAYAKLSANEPISVMVYDFSTNAHPDGSASPWIFLSAYVDDGAIKIVNGIRQSNGTIAESRIGWSFDNSVWFV